MSILIFAHFKIGLSVLLIIKEFFVYYTKTFTDMRALSDMLFAGIFFPIYDLSFHYYNGVFWSF